MKKVFIAVTAYDSKVDTDCIMSVINNMELLKCNDIKVHIHFETGKCYLPLARNNCVMQMLKTGCTDLIFVDSDVAFQADAMLKLLAPDKDIVCGLYPFKQDEEGYPVRLVCKEDGTYISDPYTGLIEVDGGPTGLMRIKREVFEQMILKYTNTKHRNDAGEDVYSLFDTGILREPEKWYGEDYLFCLRWRDMGGKVWAEPDIDFHHIGRKMYQGNYKKFVERKSNALTNMAV